MAKGIGAIKILGMTSIPQAKVEEQLKNLKPSAVATIGGFDRTPCSVGVDTAGLLPQIMGSGKSVIPFRRIREGAMLQKSVSWEERFTLSFRADTTLVDFLSGAKQTQLSHLRAARLL